MEKKLYVLKSNELIQTFHGRRTLWEQKCISYICAIIVNQYNPQKTVREQLFSFSISEFMKDCDVTKTGPNRKNIEIALDHLQVKSKWIRIQRENGSEYETSISWVEKAMIENGICYFYADEDLVPSILNLHKCFTKYECENILKMGRAASISLYELFKSYSFEKYKEFDTDWLLMHLGYDDVPAYISNFANFVNKVLLPCIQEINDLTDLDISIKTHKDGKQIKKVSVSIMNADKYIKQLKNQGLPVK